MKKFKYAIRITGFKEALEAFVPALIKLGYEEEDMEWTSQCKSLITNWNGNKGKLGYSVHGTDPDYGRTTVSASNPDLVLALAAAVDDNVYHKGEYMVNIVSRQVEEAIMFVDQPVELREQYIKATKEEIIARFQGATECKSMKEEKEIIGYKLRENFKYFESAAVSIVQTQAFNKTAKTFSDLNGLDNVNPGIDFEPSSLSSRLLKSAGVLDLWFEPVYKEEKPQFKVGDWVITTTRQDGYEKPMIGELFKVTRVDLDCRMVYFGVVQAVSFDRLRLATPEEIAAAQKKVITLRCDGGTFEIEVSKKGLYYSPESKWLVIADIRTIVRDYPSMSVSGYVFKPVVTHIDSGCKKNVPIADWKKVLDAYDSLQR